MRAFMPPLLQLLAYFASAAAALLTGVSGADFHNLNTGSFSLVFQDAQETAPGGVLNRTGQLVVLDHPTDVQVFHCDKPVATNQVQRHLMMTIPAHVRDASVRLSNLLYGLPSVLPVESFPTHGPLLTPKLREFFLLDARVFDVITIGRGEKMLQSDIHADRPVLAGRDGHVSQIAGKDRIPLVGLALDSDGVDLSFDLAVHLHLDQPDSLDAQLAVNQLDTIPVGRELNRRELVVGLKPRVARLLACLDATKEVLVRTVETPERSLATAEVQLFEQATGGSQALERGGLNAVGNTFVIAFPGRLSPAQGVIVDPTVEVEREREATRLILIGVEPKLKSLPHGSLVLLVSDVLLDRLRADAPDCSSVVAARPEGREPRTQALKLLTQYVRRVALESVGDLGDAKNGIGLNKQMHVVRTDAHLVDLDLEFSRLLAQELFEPALDCAFENWPSVLWAPHEVVLEGVNCAAVPSVSRFHNLDYIIATDIVKWLAKKGGAAIPPSLESDGPLAVH